MEQPGKQRGIIWYLSISVRAVNKFGRELNSNQLQLSGLINLPSNRLRPDEVFSKKTIPAFRFIQNQCIKCVNTLKMLPFVVNFRTGVPPYEDVVFAVKKSLATGRLSPGDKFPSVRTMSKELNLNPNTCQRAVSELVDEGILIVRTGVGTFVAERSRLNEHSGGEILNEPIEHLMVEAKQLGLTLDELIAAIKKKWDELN